MINFLLKLVPAQYKMLAKIIAVCVLLGVIAAAAISAYGWAHENGVQAERVIWQEAENKALHSALEDLQATQEKLRIAERNHATQLNAVSKNYQERLTNEKQKLNNTIASYRAGTISLRDKHADSNPAACSGATANPFAGSGRHNETEGAQLSNALAEFLIGLASEADEVVQQLTACQEVTRKDREFIERLLLKRSVID